MKQTAKLHDIVVERRLADAIRIDPLEIQDAFINCSAEIAYWNERRSLAIEEYLEAKAAHERITSKRRLIIRETMLANGEKVTEAWLNDRVATDDEVVSARVAFIEAEVRKERIRGNCEAVIAKKEMLISLGAHIRTEMEGDPLIRSQARDKRRLQTEDI